MLTVAYVAGALRKIQQQRLDDKSAHASEDALHQEVLKAIAEGACEDPPGCAKLALTSLDIRFQRWCA